ncbi:MAG: FkbM family methyltransferase [Nibricoccus sp.]
MSLAARLSTRQKITIARFLNRCVKLGRAVIRRPMHGEFTRNGIRWALDLNEGIDFAIYLLGTFERDLARSYRSLIPPGATVLDIGANIGAHTLPLAKHVGPLGRVIAIEATDYAYRKLQKNLSLNPGLQPQTTAIQAHLTATDDAPKENAIPSSWPIAGSEPTQAVLCGALRSTEGAQTQSLDTLLNHLAIPQIHWIKLDVDGHELSVLQGASKCLGRHKPNIFMELAPYCYANSAQGFRALISILTEANYSFLKLADNKLLSTDPDHLIHKEIPRNGSINILATQTINGLRSQ